MLRRLGTLLVLVAIIVGVVSAAPTKRSYRVARRSKPLVSPTSRNGAPVFSAAADMTMMPGHHQRVAGPTLKWIQKTAVGRMAARPAVVDDFVYIQTGPNVLMFTKEQGYIVQVFNSTAPPTGDGQCSPAVSGGVCYFGAENGLFFAVETSSGKQLWRTQLGSKVISSPALDNTTGLVFIGTHDGTMHALYMGNGSVAFKSTACMYSVSDGVSSTISDQTPAIISGVVYYAIGNVVCGISTTDGTEVFKGLGANDEIVASPIVDTVGQKLYVGAGGGCFYGFDISQSGSTYGYSFCGLKIDIESTGALDGSDTYSATTGGTVTKLTNGTKFDLVWSMNFFQAVYGSLTLWEDLVLAPNEIGVVAIYQDTGDVAWWYDTLQPIVGGMAVKDGILFLGDVDGTAYALNMPNTTHNGRRRY